jgi:hypothetical protein
MPTQWNNITVVAAHELIPLFYNSEGALKLEISRYKEKDYGIKKVQRGGNGRQMLIAFDSLPKEIQEAIGDPRKISNLLELYYKTDSNAVRFFTSYRFEDNIGLSLNHQEEYITNASVLIAAMNLKAAREYERKTKGGSLKCIMTTICNDVINFNKALQTKHNVQHTLPASEKRFKEAFKAFANGFDYASLISGKLKNENRKFPMYKRIDLTKLGGYPLAQEDLDWLQISYRNTFASMANFIGDMVIIDGLVEAGGNVSAGWISIGGEIVPFLAGTIGTGAFMIDELVTPLVFDDGVSKDVLYERVAKFSVTGTYNYSDLKRPNIIRDIWVSGDIKEVDCSLAYIAANFDVTGLGIGERTGWAICNGNNGTKDRSGRVSVAYNPADADFNDTANAGGEKTHTLQANEQGKLTIAVMTDDIGGGSASVIARLKVNGVEITRNGGANQSSWGSDTPIDMVAATQGHNNMQPYIVSLHIMKL